MIYHYVKQTLDYTTLPEEQQQELANALNTTISDLEQNFEQLLEEAVESIFNWTTNCVQKRI